MTINPEDKSTWPSGPWHNEPDHFEWVDQETGLPCQILRGPVGALCGYVGVTKSHPAHGVDYDPIEYSISETIEWWRRHVTQRIEYQVADIKVHGGLTFAGESAKNGIWYFGFDCAHAFDLMPAVTNHIDMKADSYRDFEYVKKECASLAKQLAAIRLWPKEVESES